MTNNKKSGPAGGRGLLGSMLGKAYSYQKGVTSQGGKGGKSVTSSDLRAVAKWMNRLAAVQGSAKPKKKKRPAGSLSTPQRGRFKRGGKVKRKSK